MRKPEEQTRSVVFAYTPKTTDFLSAVTSLLVAYASVAGWLREKEKGRSRLVG